MVGAVTSTQVAARAVIEAPDWQLSALATLPPHQSGRHSDYVDLSSLCEDAGARLIHAAQINDEDVIAQIREAEPDLVLVIGWSQICRAEFLGIRPGRVFGYHPAALPRLRGRAPIPWTILAGEPITAGTIFRIDEGVDSGDIIAQRFFHVAERETAQSLYRKHMAALPLLIEDTLAAASRSDGPISGEPQQECYATYGAKRTPEDGRIDWSAPTADIDRLIRAVGRPYPGAFSDFGTNRLTIWSAKPHPSCTSHMALPGQIVAASGGSIWVRTLDGTMEIDEWEVAGGKWPKIHDRLR